jgi:hypothetical protein
LHLSRRRATDFFGFKVISKRKNPRYLAESENVWSERNESKENKLTNEYEGMIEVIKRYVNEM